MHQQADEWNSGGAPGEKLKPLGFAGATPPKLATPAWARESDFIPIEDRWRIGFPNWDRYKAGTPGEYPYTLGHWWDPYDQNVLKGDYPILDQHTFFALTVMSDTLAEDHRLPTVAPQDTVPSNNNPDFFGSGNRIDLQQNFIVSFALFHGDAGFKPLDWEFRFTPVFNLNYLDAQETGVTSVNTAQGTTRYDSHVGIQELFLLYKLADLSPEYDVVSAKAGIQPFTSDFRGFIYSDEEPGFRIFGNYDDNKWEYNLAYFEQLDKDTNSGLNDLGEMLRKDNVFVANLYRQDFPVPGFTSQIVDVLNIDDEANTIHYDKNGFLVIPAQIGDDRGYNYNVNYLGINGDGHFGRLNLTGSGYWAVGHLSHNQFSPVPNNDGAHINAFFTSAEPSIDFDYVRLRLSGLFQSGDSNPQGGHATGFDSIFENPQFAGSDASYFIRQSLPYIGGGIVGLNQPNGVLADLRSSKLEGQSNFINSGLILAGFGTDTDILPELRMSTNVNYLRAAYTQPLEFLRHQANISNNLGYDLSVAFTYRPLDTQNIIFRVSGAALIPANGLKAIYQTNPGLFSGPSFLYAAMVNVIVTY